MSLELNKLEKVARLADGCIRARCPACAEAGHDKRGEHLRLYPDGRFGCCVYPKDHEHRKRIFALAGDKRPKAIKVKVAAQGQSAKESQPATANLLGRLGRVFETVDSHSLVVDGEKQGPVGTVGTLGTPFSYLRAYARENDDLFGTKLIGFDDSVPSVPEDSTAQDCETAVPSVSINNSRPKGKLPYITDAGDLVIPFNSPERYHWWKGGQAIALTRAELLAEGHQGKEGTG